MKKNTLIISVILVMTGLLVWSTGCKKDETNPDFLIQIDSIVMPDTIHVTDTLLVKFYGVIGPDGCYKFDRFENAALEGNDPANSMKFKIWGKHEDTGNCNQQIVYLDGAEVGINGFIKGIFNVLVVQPDGTIMVSSVYVKE
ncbi:MAG: hypothetical protein DRI89_07285 [Bacteroidetes bacterium]|nr:MAG: hypothetical protein DRI89_07285 [Bacteroidota bacterium]